jgi:hypothetical protein
MGMGMGGAITAVAATTMAGAITAIGGDYHLKPKRERLQWLAASFPLNVPQSRTSAVSRYRR